MRAIVSGSHTVGFDYEPFVNNVLTKLHEKLSFTCIIDGEAKGVDTFAHHWAQHHKIPFERFPAKWSKYGKAAGSIRNQQMIDEGFPDLVVLFPGNSGTNNMRKRAERAEIKTLMVSGTDDNITVIDAYNLLGDC